MQPIAVGQPSQLLLQRNRFDCADHGKPKSAKYAYLRLSRVLKPASTKW